MHIKAITAFQVHGIIQNKVPGKGTLTHIVPLSDIVKSKK